MKNKKTAAGVMKSKAVKKSKVTQNPNKSNETAVENSKVTQNSDKSNSKMVVTTIVKAKKREVRSRLTKSTRVEGDEDVWICGHCKGEFGDVSDNKSTEDWLSCNSCARTYHETCAK